MTSHDLPPQLRDLSAKAQFLPDTLRDALRVTLSTAPSRATPEQVLADTFARLGYLPDEAKQTALKILAEATGHTRTRSSVSARPT
jgi:hypothetical protein